MNEVFVLRMIAMFGLGAAAGSAYKDAVQGDWIGSVAFALVAAVFFGSAQIFAMLDRMRQEGER